MRGGGVMTDKEFFRNCEKCEHYNEGKYSSYCFNECEALIRQNGKWAEHEFYFQIIGSLVLALTIAFAVSAVMVAAYKFI